METSNSLIEKLLTYYGVHTNIDLSEKLGITKQTLTNWKTRNAISAIKKKCRELGIYNEIFEDNSSVQIKQGNNSRAGGRNYIENLSSGDNLENENKYEDLTISLLDKVIEKKGSEQELQYMLMDLLRNE